MNQDFQIRDSSHTLLPFLMFQILMAIIYDFRGIPQGLVGSP
jgi:hypothetical protein